MPTTLDESVRDQIEARLSDLDLTPYAASRAAGKHPSWLRNLTYRTSRSLRLATVEDVADALGCDVSIYFHPR